MRDKFINKMFNVEKTQVEETAKRRVEVSEKKGVAYRAILHGTDRNKRKTSTKTLMSSCGSSLYKKDRKQFQIYEQYPYFVYSGCWKTMDSKQQHT
jgi:hypothetical protein